MAAKNTDHKIERMENILALCIDVYHAVGVLAEREPDDDDLNELLYILKATAAIKALALEERNGVPHDEARAPMASPAR